LKAVNNVSSLRLDIDQVCLWYWYLMESNVIICILFSLFCWEFYLIIYDSLSFYIF
jgi:hypothetical protein